MTRVVSVSLPTMRRVILVALALAVIATACSGDDSEPATTETTQPGADTTTDVRRQPTGSSTFFSINEVGLGPDGWVSLTNFTDVPVTLAGLFLCQGSDCFELPDVPVQGGETVRVAAGDGSGIEGVVATSATFGLLNPGDGEIALYTSSNLDDPGAIIEYLQWGSNPHQNTAVAIEAGIWPATGGFGPSQDYATRLFRRESDGLWLFEPLNP